MDLDAAINKARWQRLIGWTLIPVTLILLGMSLVTALYLLTRDEPILQPLSTISLYVYQSTTFLNPLWKFAPIPVLTEVFVEQNARFLVITCVFILGITIRDSGAHLSARIKSVNQRNQEKGWERDLNGETRSNAPIPIRISIERRDNWYQKPIGLICLAIIAGYLVNLLSKLSGF